YDNLDSFVIFMCVEGTVEVTIGAEHETLKMGETILIPAKANAVVFNSTNAKLLEVYIDESSVNNIQHAS
ncbi:mannose-6-phosphate isomerase, partial [Olleya sp. Ti.3.14]